MLLLPHVTRKTPALIDSRFSKCHSVSLIISRLDYCYSTLWGSPANELDRLQKIQNAAARIVTRTKSLEHTTPVLRPLHWLPVTKRIEYKILCLIINVCIKPHHNISDSVFEFGENTNKKRSGARSFSSVEPTLWDRLPDKLHQAKIIASFRRQLISYLFSNLWFPHPPPLNPPPTFFL